MLRFVEHCFSSPLSVLLVDGPAVLELPPRQKAIAPLTLQVSILLIPSSAATSPCDEVTAVRFRIVSVGATGDAIPVAIIIGVT
jgi:hypothetical protein